MEIGEAGVLADPRVELSPRQAAELRACFLSFPHFLRYWMFLDQETGRTRSLGDGLWSGQRQFVEAMERHMKVYALKARKLGFTTLAIAYCGWVFRFRDYNARVHLFSRREDAAIELLRAVKFGLRNLPEWMRLPELQSTATLLQWGAEGVEVRTAKAYPANETTAVEATATHAMIDEWARMLNPKMVWQAIEPTVERGSCHIVTTGLGPVNYSATFWRDSLAEDTPFVPIFIDALQREDRNQAWLRGKRRSMTEEHFRQEYAMTWEDALYGGGEFVFSAKDVESAGRGRGPAEPLPGHRYVKAWDIGRHQDAAVGTVIDETAQPNQVVEYIRLREMPYPVIQGAVERAHAIYPGLTVIEKNGPGEAVYENLDGVPESQCELFWTGEKSKARIIEQLQLSLEGRDLQWSAQAWPQLDEEVRGYQVPDDNIVQDSVISLAIGNAHVGKGVLGRVGNVWEWS